MRKLNWNFALWAFAAVAAVSGGVYASTSWRSLDDGGAPTAGPFEGCYSSCGGEIQWPFQVSNQAVELSDGEKYLLMGTVEIRNNRAFFVVDLVKHPWLATAKRRDNPSYVLRGATDYWNGYEGKRIRLTSTAEWTVVQDLENRELRMEVILSSLADPAVVADKNEKNPAPAQDSGASGSGPITRD